MQYLPAFSKQRWIGLGQAQQTNKVVGTANMEVEETTTEGTFCENVDFYQEASEKHLQTVDWATSSRGKKKKLRAVCDLETTEK